MISDIKPGECILFHESTGRTRKATLLRMVRWNGRKLARIRALMPTGIWYVYCISRYAIIGRLNHDA